MKAFLKTTFVGGLLFLLPVVLLVVVLNHAVDWTSKLVQPVMHTLGIERLETIRTIGGVTAVTIVVLVLVSFLAGLAARTGPGKRLSHSLEGPLMRVPQYRMAKSMADGYAEVEGNSALKPVLVAADEGWQIGYLVETLADGWVVVFLPQAPTPMSGDIVYLPGDRIRSTGMTMLQANEIVMRMGAGSAAALRGTRLGPPSAGPER